jgi:hypothetical protein
MMVNSLSRTTAPQWNRYCKLGLSHIDENHYAKNITFKILRSLMSEDSRIVLEYVAGTVCFINSQCTVIYMINHIELKSV